MAFWKQAYKKSFRPFLIKESSEVIEKNINLARILVGLGIFHSYLDSLGFSILLLPQSTFKAITVLALSVFFMIGLFTPLTCGLLIYHFISPVVPYLGTMVLIMLLWGMLFIGVGRRWSIDAYLLNSPHTQRLIKYLYAFSLPSGNVSLAKIRFFILFLFWCVSVRAMVFHLDDSSWLHGKTLQLIFTTPYLTDHYLYFREFSQMFPLAYDLLCKSGLFIQSFWEILLFPLMYFGWGRIFVMVQGMAFFLISLLLLNLGYLPYYEICMWIFLFNYPQCLNLKKGRLFYDDRCNLCKKTVTLLKIIDFYDRIEVTGLSQAPVRVQKAFPNDTPIIYGEKEDLFAGFSAYYQICKNIFPFCFLFPLFVAGKVTRLGGRAYSWVALRRKKLFGVCEPFFYSSKNRQHFKPEKWSVKFFSLFLIASILSTLISSQLPLLGQGRVDVMSADDLKMGAPGIVLIETYDNYEFKRTVPFMDINGGRLSYLRNNLLYFNYSQGFQRLFTKEKNPNRISEDFKKSFETLAQVVGILDSCLSESSGARYYRADLYLKELKSNSSFEFWGMPKKVHSYLFSVNMKQLKISEPKCQRVYNLPPGHLYSDKRIGLTRSFYKNGPRTENKP